MTSPARSPIDLADPNHYADGIPHALIAQLRRTSPIVWVDEPATGTFPGGPGYWLVLRHADVSHVSRNPMIFSSWQGTSFLRDPKPSDVAVLRRMMLNMDPPEHTKLRKIVNRAFTPQAIRRQLADSITRHARDVVDLVCELGKIDFLTDVAAEMPLRVLADVLGVPTEDRHLLYKWTNALVGLDDPEYGDPQAFLAAFVEMFSYARQRTAEKRARPGDDVWSTIVTAEVNGERLSDDDLDRFFQLLVIAGNDTTRNLIANTLLTLSSHPGQLARLRADLGLIPSAIEEVLRYAPSVIQFRRTATQDAELAGQQISAGDKVIINYASANRDEAVFADPDRFDIGRDPNPHISFGDGTHFCLGANLARLQARTLLSELFSRLPDITATGTPTRLRSSFMNGIKHLTAEFTPAPPRRAATSAPGVRTPDGGQRTTPATPAAQEAATPGHGTPLLVLYGSNFGTAEETAEQVAARAAQLGFGTNVAALDDHINDLPRDGAVAVVAATYNGTPPDNAVGFARWLTEDHPDLTGVSYVVFGCGNREWAATFQQFPQFIDEQMAALGARRLHARGEGDAAGDFDGQFEQWTTGLWPALAEAFQIDLGATAPESAAPRYRIEYVPGNRQSPFVETLGARPMRVRASRELTTPLDGAAAAHPVRHIELALPEDISYAAGDHLGVIPHNSESLVRRVAVRFGLDLDAHIRLYAEEAPGGFLPTGERITLRRLLADYVELLAVAGRRDIQTMLAHTEYPWTRTKLQALLDPAGDGRAYREDVLGRRRSVLDLLEEHPTCQLPFPVYLQLLKPLAPRYYSISSSPRVDPAVASITVGALAGPAWAGRGRFEGVCSNYLCGQEAGQVIYAFVRDTSSSFRLPPDLTRPVIMIAAGTGIAPYRGFLAERAARAATGEQPGPGLLVFGCRHPQADLLYGDELAALANAAGIQLACAYSRVPDLPRVYVQDRLRELGEHVWPLLEDNAVIYVCGSTAMAGGVREALNDLHREHTGSDAGQAESWLAELGAQHRYLVDVWASG